MQIKALLRSSGALPLALLATLMLVWLMKSLIEVGIEEDRLQVPPVGLVYLPEALEQEEVLADPEPPQPHEPEPEPPDQPPLPEPEPLPESMELPLDNIALDLPAVARPPEPEPERKRKPQPISKPQEPTPRRARTTSAQAEVTKAQKEQAAADNDFSDRPTYRPHPSYPSRARRRRIEGEVTVRFTVTTTGSVGDLSVVSASPPGLFEQATLEAVRRWRYPPQPASRPGVLATVRFELRGHD